MGVNLPDPRDSILLLYFRLGPLFLGSPGSSSFVF